MSLRTFSRPVRLPSKRLMIAAAVIGLAASPVISYAQKTDTFKMLTLFGDVFERVKSEYVEPVSDEKLIENALNGMLTALDPHSSYLNDKAFTEMQVQTKGEFGGIGIEITMENGLVKVVSPIDETPAAKAGIHSGDMISHINGEQVMGLTLPEAVEKMRGPVGTQVKITVLREGEKEPLEFLIKRDTIRIQSVRSRAENDIAYIRVSSFTEKTYPELARQYEDLEKKIGKDKLKGLVLDLRNNPGGLLDQAIAVSDAFLEQGEIVSTRGRNPESAKRFNAQPGDISHGLPVVVLINGGSASASEIVSGALQDHKRAIVLGTKSFGKGSVQTVIPLPGHGAIRLTTSRYYTPSGHSIQAKGIEPDILVEPAKVEPIKQKNLFMRSEAELRGRLSNPEDKSEPELPQDKPAKPIEKPESKPDGKDDDAPESMSKLPDSAKDFQLMRALDLLRGIALYKQSGAAVAPAPVAAPAPATPAQ